MDESIDALAQSMADREISQQKAEHDAAELSQDQRTPEAWANPPWKQQFRIEALRAASRVVAGLASDSDGLAAFIAAVEAETPGLSFQDVVLKFAEQFARWLETGER